MENNEKCVILSKKEYDELIRRICNEILERTHEIVKKHGDERLSTLDEALNIINVFENLPWWKRIFYKPNYFKQ